MTVRRRIFKQGNSLVITLPAYLLEEIRAKNGSYLDIHALNGKFLILSLSVNEPSIDETEKRIRLPPIPT